MRFKLLVLHLLLISSLGFSLENLNNLIIPNIKPGSYNSNIELSFATVKDFELYYSFNDSLDKKNVKYIFPISLSAANGESREYTIKVSARDDFEIVQSLTLTYTIDKNVPEPPVLNYTEGLYDQPLNLKFIDKNSNIYYELGSDIERKYKLWNGEEIAVEQADKLKTEYIKSYSEDTAGNRSIVKVQSFTMLPIVEVPESLFVLSPVEGEFLNSQLIYIDSSGYKWIRYSFNDIDPVTRGTSYIKPVLVTAVGNYKLNIAAMPYNSSTILKKEINFSIINTKDIIVNKPSGVYSEELNLKFNTAGLRFTLEERPVDSIDLRLPDLLSIIPIPEVVKYKHLRISQLDEEGEYRYFYALDKRVPAAPVISVSSRMPISAVTEVRILGVSGADIYYTLDGSTPDRYSSYYRRPFKMEIPQNRTSGSLLIKSVAYFNDKSISPIASKLITFDITKPEKPILEIISKTPSEVEIVFKNNSGNRIIFNITYDGTEPSEPELSSFTGSESMKIKVPNGSVYDIKISAAYVNQAGNISEITKMDINKTDTIPPLPPEIQISENKITIIGEKTIWYKISENNFSNSQDYTVYNSPVVISTDDKDYINIKISAFSIDYFGNKSSVSTFNKIILDNRVPVIPSYSGVKNGGLYNSPRSLRFHTAEDIKIFYTLTIDSSIPDNPSPETSETLEEYLFFDCPVNETRDYTVKLLASYPGSEMESKIEIISFRIDRISPRAPVIRSIRDGAVYNSNITIPKNEEGDYLWVLIKDIIEPEDLTVSNFESNGILLDNDYIIKLDSKVEKKYQLASLAIDEAGNAIIGKDIIKFTIDKLPPLPPEVKIDNSSVLFTNIRMLSPDMDDIKYEISFDGTYPPDPDRESPLYDLPIQLEKEKLKSVFIKARTIDSSGNLSNEIIFKKILTDNEYLSVPEISVSQINSSKYLISFPSSPGNTIFMKIGDGEFLKITDPVYVGLRDQNYLDIFYFSESSGGSKSSVAQHRIDKITSSGKLITGVNNNKIYNTGRVVWKSNESRVIRYEVALGDDIPKAVNVFSPELTEPILFDAGKGETVKITLNVKEFSDNIPVLEKYDNTVSFVIDKTMPEAPTITGVSNNDFFTDNRTVELKSDSSIFYRLSSDSGDLPGIEFEKYTEPLSFNVIQGKSVLFNIELYSKDSAGNRSITKLLQFTIDKANVFVSSKGSDGNDGTRDNPFKTLDKAIVFAGDSQRSIINIAEGEYLLKNTLNIEKTLTIIGGYKPAEWVVGNGITLLNIPGRNSGKNSLVNVLAGKVVLENLTLTNINLKAPIIKVTGGILDLVKINLFHANNSVPVTVSVNSGFLSFRDSVIHFGPIANGNLFTVKNGNITFTNSRIIGTGNVNSLNIFDIVDSNLEINNSTVTPSDGGRISFIVSSGSKINVSETTFTNSTSLIITDIFLLDNSKLFISKFNLETDNQSRILSVFDLDNSQVKINNSKFNLNAKTGISFGRSLNSTFEIYDSSLITGSTDEFVYLMKSDSSIIDFQNNNVETVSVDIFKGFEFIKSVSVFNNNRIILGGGNTLFSSFYFKDSLSTELINNTVVSNNKSWISSDNQAAISITGGKDSVIINGNNIYGWDFILNHNGSIIKTPGELNNYSKFLDIPEDNYSKKIN